MTRTNPIENANQESEHVSQYAYLTTGRVTSSPRGQSDGAHHVVVQESAAPSDEPLPVLPSVHGDYYVPPEGAPVIVSPMSKNDYAVIAGAVPATSTPNIEPGERVLSHPESGANVKFNNDGSIDIHGDATVRINGGDQGAITDVQPGGTNSNGGITSLDITRNNDILL